ncbi:MAG: bifunctional molybdenum cofactor biosynthesis protein MoaC/MoaB [Ruminococcus sp.]
MCNKLSHFDKNGNAVMMDVSDKPITHRTAIATGSIQVGAEIMEHLTAGTVAKGDVLGVARVAGIMSVKHTSDLVPMCHPLPVTKCTIDFEIEKENGIIRTFCTVKTDGKTGVEMEALTGVQVTLLTIYDMCKAIDKHMVMTDIHLVEKTGGKSGDFLFKEIKTKGRKMKRVAIITSSDMGFQGKREDLSGPAIKEIAEREGYQVVSMDILPDDRAMLSRRMAEIADENQAELILTTGGTGFSPRDVMPEATEDITERKVPGIPEAIRAYSMTITKRAMLSRATAGIRKRL